MDFAVALVVVIILGVLNVLIGYETLNDLLQLVVNENEREVH